MALINDCNGDSFPFGVLIQKSNICIPKSGMLPNGSDIFTIIKQYPQSDILSYYGEKECATFAAFLSPDAAVPKEFTRIPYRNVFAEGNAPYAGCTARAVLLLNWLYQTKYCSSCGTLLHLSTTETAQVCPRCGRVFYPIIAPCIIVLISRGDKILLARHIQHTTDIYTCIAGFIEAGESAEDAVIREVHEEVGLTVQNIRYRGSQGWPYPNQLMLAFRAEYVSGDIVVQKEELSDAAWFRKDALPPVPRPGSAAYRLICGDWY